MKHKIILACGIAVLITLCSASPVSANPCTGRRNGIPPADWRCGCDWDVICVDWPPCDPRHNPTGICTPCGAAWQPPCLFETACDEGTFNIGVLCVPCGDTWYPQCPTGDPCDPWHNPAVICTPCGGQAEPLCWSGEQCKPGYEVEGWEFPLCYAKPAAGPEPVTGYTGAYTDSLMPKQPEGEPLWGWVDTHEHQFANLAYGGATFWGQVFDEDGGVSEALAECDYTTEEEFDEIVLPSLWGMVEEPPEFLSEWLAGIADEYTHMGLDWVGDQLDWLAETILSPFGPVGDWLLSLLDLIPDDWDWLVGWLPGAIDGFIEWLEPQVGPLVDFLGPAFVQGLYIDLDPLIPPWAIVPRYGIHGDDPVKQPTSPSQFWLGLTNNIAVLGGPENFHEIDGWPDFEGWPTYEQGGHQQMYYKWLERAYQGGMRLLINLPVHNEVLCEMSFQREGWGCDDMETADRQIDRIYELEEFVDLENDGLVNGNGWYRVALSASDARDIIEDGALAVIIGIEVDTPFGCEPGTNYCCEYGPPEDCLELGYEDYEDFIDQKVQEYYDKGVRYMFPVHFWNNKFTGSALYRDYFTYAQLLANGTCFDLYDCSEDGIKGYAIGGDIPILDWVNKSLAMELGLDECVEYSDYQAQGKTACNALGLTYEGQVFLQELMERDMLFDRDHFSLRAIVGYTDTYDVYQPGILDVLEDWDGSRGYKYPIISGHSGLVEDRYGGLTMSQAERIRQLGGVISINQPKGPCKTTWDFVRGEERFDEEVAFSLTAAYTPTLNAEEMSQQLWDAFATNGYTLTADYTGTVVVQIKLDGLWWRIVDSHPDTGARYVLELSEDETELRVHEAMMVNGLNHTAEVMSEGLPEKHQGYPRIGLRADFGAFLPETAPRLGPEPVLNECEFDRDPTQPALQYPFESPDPYDGTATFTRTVTGNQTWDFNTDGLAHVGLFPDLIADAELIAGYDDQLELDPDYIFHSAEAYIRMWEWIESCTPDEVDPTITCPATIVTSGPVGGRTVVYDPPPTAEDYCDWIPPDTTTVETDIPSGAHFDPGVTTVTAEATDSADNTSQCQFDVQVSCFNVNQAHVGTKEGRGNKVSFKGTFRPATTVDATVVDVMYSFDDGNGHTWEFTIPAGSFEVEGKPSLQKYRYNAPKGADLDVSARFDFSQCTFEVEFTDVEGTDEIVGSSLTFFLQTDYAPNHNYGQDTVDMEVTTQHLQYEREVPLDCCP